MKRHLLRFATLILASVPLVGASAATVEWNNTGTSWSTGSDWAGGVAPASDLTTDIAAFGSTGSSPVNPTISASTSISGISFLSGAFNYTFGGSSILTIGANGIAQGSATSSEAFANTLTVRASTSEPWSNAGTLTFNGTVDINQNSATSRTITLSGAGATIFSGVIQNSKAGSTGNLTYNGSGNGSLTLANANTYTGTTTIGSGSVTATHDGAFGTGNVSLTGSAINLTLQGGTANDYIANSAALSVKTGDVITLNYGTTDIIGSFLIDGVSQPVGIYNAVNEPGLLFGTGSITVVPEPSSWAMAVVGAGLLVAAQQLRRRRA